ncbi:MAG: ester cyclase [Chloroflexi bacterium]|nr:ester cyclase [Chloroflexota bacterium]MCI0645548.1 ester cyclase [Chloroflexota bacterium]MCI0727483.1 ester cyclase [Chloroflexota bacterium]
MKEKDLQSNIELLQAFVAEPAAVSLADNATLADHAQNCVFKGRAAVANLLRALFQDGFPGSRAEVQSIVADERTAVLEFIFCGRQGGPFLGIPATGRAVVVPMVLVCRLANAQIQQAALYYDAGTLLRQLGLAL